MHAGIQEICLRAAFRGGVVVLPPRCERQGHEDAAAHPGCQAVVKVPHDAADGLIRRPPTKGISAAMIATATAPRAEARARPHRLGSWRSSQPRASCRPGAPLYPAASLEAEGGPTIIHLYIISSRSAPGHALLPAPDQPCLPRQGQCSDQAPACLRPSQTGPVPHKIEP